MINLLPPEEKAILLKERNFRLTLIMEIMCLVFLLCLILVLLQVKILMAGKVDYQKALLEVETESPTIQEFREKINLINQDIIKLENFYKQETDLTGILEKISAKLLPGMYLTSISYSKSISQVSLSGFAPTRAMLTGPFKENLQEEFQDVVFPTDILTKDKDIEFIVNFKIND